MDRIDLRPHFASEIERLDFDALESLLIERKVLVVRNSGLDAPAFVKLMRSFGEPMSNMEHLFKEFGKAPLDPDRSILEVSSDGFLDRRELDWHSDSSYLPDQRIPIGGLLAVHIPEVEITTSWCDANWAYERIPDDLKEKFDGKSCEQSNDIRYTRIQGSRLPFVRSHPVTGKKRVMMDSSFLRAVEGYESTDEFESIRNTLMGIATVPENVYRHHWREGDLVLYENSSTLHYRDPIPSDVQRTLWRILVYPKYYGCQIRESLV